MSRKILTVVGARPQFIKAAPVTDALAAQGGLREVMVHTGQHYDANMSDVFFSELGIARPRHELNIHGGRHGSMTGRMIVALEEVMIDEKPDAVMIYGDTNSTLAGAIAAAKLDIPIAHIEAGLRAFRKMPEETNRILADRVSTWLFCPTEIAVSNLAREDIRAGAHLVGDVMYDEALRMSDRARKTSTILSRIGLERGRFQLATLHRAENTESRDALARAVGYLREAHESMPVVLPLHPRTRQASAEFGIDLAPLTVVDPVGYLDMMALLDGCDRVLTDSGGLQKEAFFCRKPCVTLRDATEWVETVEAGWNRLWSSPSYLPRREISPYGDGKAAVKIVEILAAAL